MYCIISLPRTASTFTWYQIQAGLMMKNPLVSTQSSNSIFNPRYNTSEEITRKFQETLAQNPLPLIKIISNHNWDMVDDIITSDYKTVFLKPKNVRRYVLKNVVAKQTDSYGNKKARDPFVGTLTITESEIQQRLDFYYRHMEFESKCDYSFYDLDVLDNPHIINERLRLPIVNSKYKYSPPNFTDEQMLQDVNDFNQKFERLYERQR